MGPGFQSVSSVCICVPHRHAPASQADHQDERHLLRSAACVLTDAPAGDSMQTILTTQQRTRLLQEADPGYLDVLREQWQQRCTDNRLLSVADRIRYLEETAIPELLAGNIVTEAGQYAYAGPLDRLDDALENALAAPARGRRRRVLWLLIPAVLLFWLGFTLLGSDDTTAATTTALGGGECAGEADAYGSSVRSGQPCLSKSRPMTRRTCSVSSTLKATNTATSRNRSKRTP